MRDPSRSLTAAAAVACCVAAAGAARAQGAPSDAPREIVPLELAWEAPADACPDRAAALATIARLLGRPVVETASDAAARALAVRVRIARSGGARSDAAGAGWRMQLESQRDGEAGERTVDGPSCERVANAAALAIALAIDPQAVATGAAAPPPPPPNALAEVRAAAPQTAVPAPPTAPRPSPPPPSVRAAVRVAAPPRPRAPRRAAATRVALRVDAGLDVSSLPAPSAMLTATAALLLPVPLRLEAGATYVFAQTATAPVGDGSVSARVWLLAARARACVRAVATPRVEFAPCLAAELGAMTAALDSGGNAARSGLWFSALAGADLYIVLVRRRLALHASLEAGPVAAPEIVLGDHTLFRPAVITGRGAAGLEVRFP